MDLQVRATLPRSLDYGEFCEFVFAHGSSMHQKCFNYALTNLWFGLCRSVWIIDLLVTFFSPIPELQHAFNPKVLWAREHAQLLLLPLSSPLDSQLSPSRSLGGASICQQELEEALPNNHPKSKGEGKGTTYSPPS
jgi:hypothetical protein